MKNHEKKIQLFLFAKLVEPIGNGCGSVSDRGNGGDGKSIINFSYFL